MTSLLIGHLWQSTLFIVAAQAVAWLLRNNRARVRYWIWLAASIKLLLPFSFLIWMGTQAPWPSASTVVQQDWMAVVDQIGASINAPAIAAQTAATARADTQSPLLPIGILVWACGFAAIAARWFKRWRTIRSIRYSAKASPSLAGDIPVAMITSPALIEPGVFGLFRPALLLPESIVQRLNPDQLKAILEHELCHVRYRDNLTAAIHMVAEAIYWFYPLVWWLGARLIDERERACDEEVLRQGGDPGVYAEGILQVCKHYVESPLACVSGVTGSNLKERIEAIMKNRILQQMTGAKKTTLACAAIAAVLVPVAIGILDAPSVRAQGKDQPIAANAARLSFDVVSIRRAAESGAGGAKGAGDPASKQPSGRFYVRRTPLMFLIYRAYDIRGCQSPNCPWVKGGPKWIREDMFEINAKVPDGFPEYAPPTGGRRGEPAYIQQMVQSMLADRFGLRVHRENSEAPVFVLTVGKDGPKLKASDDTDTRMATVTDVPGKKEGTAGLLGRKASMAMLVSAMISSMDRPVIDGTGLSGTYDFLVEAEIDQTAEGPSQWNPYIEQLGLKLESRRAPVEVLVIDKAEPPSDN